MHAVGSGEVGSFSIDDAIDHDDPGTIERRNLLDEIGGQIDRGRRSRTECQLSELTMRRVSPRLVALGGPHDIVVQLDR